MLGEDNASLSAGLVLFGADGEATMQSSDHLLQKDVRFDELGLSQSLLQGVRDIGYVNPSKIHANAFRDI